MRTRHLSLTIAAYRNEPLWALAYIEKCYDGGKLVSRRVVARRVVSLPQLRWMVELAVEKMILEEEQRRDSEVEAAEREDSPHQDTLPLVAPAS